MTNYEKIKAMSVEEMAEFMDEMLPDCDGCPAMKYCIMDHKTCEETIKKYLESEAEENMLPEICSCGYRFETDETICPNCGKRVEDG